MIQPSDFLELRPSSRDIATAYLRIAHIYRQGGLPRLALDYYRLVISRFPVHCDLTMRARLHAARCLAATGEAARSRQHLLALVADPRARAALAGRAALELLRQTREPATTPLTPGERIWLERQVQSRLTPAGLARWHRTARRLDASSTIHGFSRGIGQAAHR